VFEIGQWMDNQYLVLEKHLGRRWIVYIALDRISENVFVIKAPSNASPPVSEKHFRQKAKYWIDFGHCEEIAIAFMLKDFGGAPYLFIEYVEGPSLADIICSRPGKPLPIDQTIALMKEIIRGMKALHGASLLTGASLAHGNLCPRNILTRAGNIKITDVGLAGAFRLPGGMMNADLFLRDIPCIAPEQIEHPEKESHLADIYSFGAVMYEMATGTAPTLVRPTDDPLSSFAASGPIPPRARNRHCPKWLDETILKCMSTEPERRFQSFEQIEVFVEKVQKEPEKSKPPDENGKGSARASRVARVRGMAKKESSRLNHYYLGVEHIMLGILAEEEAVVLSVIDDKVTSEQLRSEIVSNIPKGEGPWQWDGIIKTPRYRRVMKMARKIRHEYADERMLPQHILLAILQERQNVPVRALQALEVNIDAAVKTLRKELARRRPSIMVTDPGALSTPFAHKMSCVAGGPYFTPFLGRDRELHRAQDLLLSERKSILLLGEPGVGKTSFMRQLACVIPEAAARTGVEHGSIYLLRTAALLASDADGEKILDNIADTLKEAIDSNSTLLIEDLPTLLDISVKMPPKAVANILTDCISSQKLLVAATATPATFAQCETENEGLLRLLEIVDLHETSEEETLAILRGAKQAFEAEHSVTITEDAFVAAVGLLEKSPQSRVFPAGAIELLDSACAIARLESALRKEQEAPIIVAAEQVEHAMDEAFPSESARQDTNPGAFS